MQKGIEAKIVEKGETKSLLEVAKQRLILDSVLLPEKAAQGAKIKLYFLLDEEVVTSEKKLAKIILEEILNGK